jgi:hypothetical protein
MTHVLLPTDERKPICYALSNDGALLGYHGKMGSSTMIPLDPAKTLPPITQGLNTGSSSTMGM